MRHCRNENKTTDTQTLTHTHIHTMPAGTRDGNGAVAVREVLREVNYALNEKVLRADANTARWL